MSGGERTFIDACLTRAIALYLAQNTGRRFDTLFSDEADGPFDPEHKRMFMAMKRQVLRLGGYRQEFFITQTPHLATMADAIIDLDAMQADAHSDIDLVAETELASNTYVSGTLHFNNAKLTLNGSFLRIESGGEVSGMSAAGYIVTNGVGRLVQEVLNTNVVYPIGTHTDFTPMVLKNTGTIDYFGIRVFNDVLDGGSSGTSIPEIDHCVNITWDIIEQINGGSDLTLTAYWGNAVEGSLFDRSIAGLGHFTGGSWDPQPAQDASGLAPHSITRSGITSLSVFAVPLSPRWPGFLTW